MSNVTKFIMLVGLPASGKSTYAKELSKIYNAVIVSSDDMRKELFGDINCQDKNDYLFNQLKKRIKEFLRDGKSVIMDATNISSKKRKSFLVELTHISCRKECVIVATPYEECLKRNKLRDRVVPEEVIKRMYLNWNTPYWFEGWDDIIIYHTEEPTMSVDDWLEKHKNYNQDNPHHLFSLADHCYTTFAMLFKYIADDTDKITNTELFYAASIHDCGKPFTKSFVNSKGETTEVAHYYQHHCCGAYDSLFFKYILDVNCLNISILVNLHMMPYQWEKDKNNGEKTRLKYKNLWREKLYEDVMKLHRADQASHRSLQEEL